MDAAHAKGGNMCIQRTLLADGRFATDHVNFGAGGCDAGGEDTELVRRLSVRTRIRHVPAAQVRHIVASREMTWSAVSGRYRRIGRSNAAQGLAGPGLGRPGARALVYGCLAAVAFAVGARAIAARYGIFTAMQIGALEQLLGKES
jgi:hypothetical protein